MSFMLKKLKISLSKKEWIKGVMRRLWFYELFDAVLFLRLMSVGEIATWVFLDWKGWGLSKPCVVYGTLVFRTESVDGKQRKGFYVISYSDQWVMNLASRWSYFCTYLHAIQCWSENFLLWMGEGWGGGEIRTCTSCCLRDIKVMKTVTQSSTNQNSCKCLREALTICWLEGQYLGRRMVVG